MFKRLHEDIACILERDPAARSPWEVLTCYPGLHALVLHRRAKWFWQRDLRWLARFTSHVARFLTGIEIHPGATIGHRVFIDHALGRGVIVGANSQVLGGFTVGDGARIGSSAVVVKPVPPGATAVGNPARIIQHEQEAQREAAAAKMGFSAYGVSQGDDPLSQAMKGLIDNASGHEHQITMLWAAIEKLSARARELPVDGCVPQDAQTTSAFDAERLNRLVK
jgi:serine O-acetyltransferase